MTTATLDFDQLTLTADQQAALDALYVFLVDPVEQVFVLQGYSGCGKSTLVRILIDRLPDYQKTVQLINPSAVKLEVQMTATTNKAAENLSQITGMEVRTIYSALGLRVQTDFKRNTTTLVLNGNAPILENLVLFIDEASYMDKELMGYLFARTRNCKIVLIGDPAQLTQVGTVGTPVAFKSNFKSAALTQVTRHGGPILEWATLLRNTVNTGVWTPFKPDGHAVRHMDREQFKREIAAEFTRLDWKYADSKILAWTNKRVIDFNQFVRNLAKGDPHFQVGDYAVCNSFLTVGKGVSIKTDQLVQITAIEDDTEHHDVPGNWVALDYRARVFQPKRLEDKNLAIKRARASNELHKVAEMEMNWSDLRGAYACTINKAQGSTFGSVFIDLDDIARCNSGDQIARMLYVGVSRAKNHVYLTGDLA